MKRKFLSFALLTVLILTVCMSANANANTQFENEATDFQVTNAVQPFFIAIVSTYNNLILNSGGRLTCKADTTVQYGYTAGVTVELQQYINGKWSPIKSWSNSTANFSALSNDWYVTKGYSYKLKTTHTALSNGSVIETFSMDSNIVNYF